MADENEIVIRLRRDDGDGGRGGGGDEGDEGRRGSPRGGFAGAFVGGAVGAVAGPMIAGILKPITDLLTPLGAGLGTMLLEPLVPVLSDLAAFIKKMDETLDRVLGNPGQAKDDFVAGINAALGGPSAWREGSWADRALDRIHDWRRDNRSSDPTGIGETAATLGIVSQEVWRTLTGQAKSEADMAHDPQAIYANPNASRAHGGGS